MQNKLVKHFYGPKPCRKNAWILKIVSLLALFFLSSSSFAAGVGGCGGEGSFPPAYPLPQIIIEPLPIGAPVPRSRVTYTMFSRKGNGEPCSISFNMPPTISNGYKTVYESVPVENMRQDQSCGNVGGCIFSVMDTTQSAALRVKMSLVYVGPPQTGEFVVQMAEGARTTDLGTGAVTYWNVSRPLHALRRSVKHFEGEARGFREAANLAFSGRSGRCSRRTVFQSASSGRGFVST
jgi:hypothetical protein